MDTQFIDETLYDLERQFGVTLTIRDWESNVNRETGEKVQTKVQLDVKALKLPPKTFREFFYDVGFLRANSNFTYGAIDTFKEVTVLVRKRNCHTLVPNNNRDAILEGKRYDTVTIEDVDAAWVLTLKNVGGSETNRQVDVLQREYLGTQESQ